MLILWDLDGQDKILSLHLLKFLILEFEIYSKA